MPPKRKMKTSILNPKIDIIGKEKVYINLH